MVRVQFGSSKGGSGKPTSFIGKVGMSLFFLIFGAAGTFFMVMLVGEMAEIIETYGWDSTACVIQSSEMVEVDDDEEPYGFAATYVYDFEGASYTSSAFRRDETSYSVYSDVQVLLDRYRAGEESVCFVNSGEPGESILERGSLWFGLFAVLPGVFMFVGFGGVWMVWRGEGGKETRVKSISSEGVGKGGMIGLSLFLGLFIVVGLGVFWGFMVWPTLQVLGAEDWVEVECVVESSRIQIERGEDSTTYRADILYRYEVDGVERKSNRYSFFDVSSDSQSKQREYMRAYPVGKKAVCYVDPDEPTEVVLDRGMHASVIGLVLPLFFVGIPGGILLIVLKGERSKQKLESLTQGVDGVGKKKGGAYAVDGFEEGVGVGVGGGGPVVLKPTASRVGKLIGMTCMAVFWNGIVSVFVWQAVESWQAGRVDWFLTLFMIPFVLIGLGLIGGIVYFVLGLFNPKVVLTVNAKVVRLGEPLDVAWDVEGDARKFKSLHIALEGREEATYKRGTNTHTDKKVFHSLVLMETDEGAAIAGGAETLTVPLDTMHSWEAVNNKIVWELKVQGDIPKWPDVKAAYGVVVLPSESNGGTR